LCTAESARVGSADARFSLFDPARVISWLVHHSDHNPTPEALTCPIDISFAGSDKVSRVAPGITLRPRVLQVVLSLNPGGTERLVVEIVNRLRSELTMTVCCLDEDGVWGDELKSAGVDVKALRRGAGFRPMLGRHIAQFAARHDATVIHCHHYSPFVYSCIARLWNPRLRIVFTEHGRLSDAPPSAKRRAVNRLLSRVPREVVAVSADLKEHLVAEGFSSAEVSVIHNGIDVGPLPDRDARACARRTLAVPDQTFVIGTVARLDPVKDVVTLIHATAALARHLRVALIVIGDGDERARLEELAAQCDARPHVRFLGHRDDARALLAGCDVYVNSSISEGISLTILEAMAAGLPIIATRVGGTPEIIDETCGRLVPARDREALTAALGELAADRSLRETLARTARQRVEKRFTIERMVREYRDAYYRAAD
jgi:L-malate glycosyltransferase